jgi:hypothetical protein
LFFDEVGLRPYFWTGSRLEAGMTLERGYVFEDRTGMTLERRQAFEDRTGMTLERRQAFEDRTGMTLERRHAFEDVVGLRPALWTGSRIAPTALPG